MSGYYTCRQKVEGKPSGLCLEPTVDGTYCKEHAEANVSFPARVIWPQAEPLERGELPWGGV